MMMTWLPYFSLVIAFTVFAIGAFAVVRPKPASRLFGVPSDSPYVIAAGARDIFIGLVLFLVFMHFHFHLLGEVCVACAVVPFFDFLITVRAGARREAAMHASGFIAMIVYGAILIWF